MSSRLDFPGHGTLYQPDPVNDCPSKETINAIPDLRQHVLQLQAAVAGDAYGQRRAGVPPASPAEFQGHTVLGNVPPDDFWPMLKDVQLVKTKFFQHGPCDGRHHLIDALGAPWALLASCLSVELGHISS